MPDIEVTDQLGAPVTQVKVDPSHPSTLIRYLKTELLHLAVLPDFVQRKDEVLSKVAPKPIQFEAKAQHEFELGGTKPTISITPEFESAIRVNASPGTNLFDGDPFHLPCKVPTTTSYVSIALGGSVEAGATASDGDLTFGFEASRSLKLEHLKAFPLGAGERTLAGALGETLSSYVIPADVSDLGRLAMNDIATVSGSGRLKVSGGVKLTVIPNPLASAALPLGAPSVQVKAGPVAGVSATFEITGSYQIRAWRKSADVIELSISPERSNTLKADFSASAGVSAGIDGQDFISAIIETVTHDPSKNAAAIVGLQGAEAKAFSQAVKSGLDHSLQACIDAVFSASREDEPAFQYQLELSKLSPDATLAVNKALRGDLSSLTSMEAQMPEGGLLAPGLTMLNSILSQSCKLGATLKLNLIGILNFTSVSELIRHSEILTEASGDVTIKETVSGTKISALTDPLKRAEAIRKAMYDSVLTTATYRAGKAVSIPELVCEQVHSAFSPNTKLETVTEYLKWFRALDLATEKDQTETLRQFTAGGNSNCILRTTFIDGDCELMFFDDTGKPRKEQFYRELGRQAMRALLDGADPNDAFRAGLLDDAVWPQAVNLGPTPELAGLAGINRDDPRLELLIGDVDVILSWARAMVETGPLIHDVRTYVGQADPKTLASNPEFKSKREALQKKLASVVSTSKVRFEEPWGMVCLFRAAGSPKGAYAKAVISNISLERGSQRTVGAGVP